MQTTHLILRPMGPPDGAALYDLLGASGPGLTSLPRDRAILDAKLAHSWENWLSPAAEPNGHKFLFALEDARGELIGVSGIAARVGLEVPFYNFRVSEEHQLAGGLGFERRHQVLMACNDCSGWSEIGSLFVHPRLRGTGAGRLASHGRFLFLATHGERFAETVFAELRGVSSEAGDAPLWDALGRHFFPGAFAEADHLSAVSDKRFIAELLPRHPIYADLLPPEARAVIGQAHPRTEPARRLLEAEGFRFRGLVDIFDGGPVISCERQVIRSVREARPYPVSGQVGGEVLGQPHLIAAGRGVDFRCCLVAHLQRNDDGLSLSASQQQALGVEPGQVIHCVAVKRRAQR